MEAVPAFRNAVARGGDRAVLAVAEVDARILGVECQRGLVDDRQQDLLEVERGVQRPAGAHDGAILDRAPEAPFLGFQASEAGGGLLGGELGDLDVVGADLAAGLPGDDDHAADLVGPAHRDEERRLDAVVCGASGDDLGARARVGHRERPAGLDHAGRP